MSAGDEDSDWQKSIEQPTTLALGSINQMLRFPIVVPTCVATRMNLPCETPRSAVLRKDILAEDETTKWRIISNSHV